jgi:hypothetical protein
MFIELQEEQLVRLEKDFVDANSGGVRHRSGECYQPSNTKYVSKEAKKRV